MNRLGILTSGGDAPGMNACIRAVVRHALNEGLEVMGIRRGYSGLLAGEVVKLNFRSVANIIQRGGTILETSRCADFLKPEGRRDAAVVLEQNGIDGLVIVGGDGSFRGASALMEETSTMVIGVPATIDNDVYGIDYTIGFDTAVNTAMEAIDKVRDTADAFERIFFVEVMGRDAGFIALQVAVAAGAAEVIVPEQKTDLDQLCRTLSDNFKRGKRSNIVVVAEGNKLGHSLQIAQYVENRLNTSCRACVLGHLQRGGAPTAKDRVLATRLGAAAVEGILKGKHGHMVGQRNGQVVYVPMRETWEKKKELAVHLFESLKVLGK
ncbi:MAG: 6-phosphofructokinase [Chloroflexi bacterium]|nr:6-phosphofructokinase [Chloroflexota bacterium]